MDPTKCKSIEDVKVYLVSWLTCDFDHALPRQGDWEMVLGFRRAYSMHQVWRNKETNQCAFHVSETDDWSPGLEPTMGMWESFDEMLSGVAKAYHRVWSKNDDVLGEFSDVQSITARFASPSKLG